MIIKSRHPSFYWPMLVFVFPMSIFMIFAGFNILKEHYNWFMLLWTFLSILLSIYFFWLNTTIEIIEIKSSYISIKRGPFGLGVIKKFDKVNITKFETIINKSLFGVEKDRLFLTINNERIQIGKFITNQSINDLVKIMKDLNYDI